ncbi:MAG: EF-hand domain-containing protein [Rhizobiales bacterium]|nr:EF-hand domain-containing protein [Hyphomicrobiales bacterium]MBI3674554.1 EF-hand domain-containing protein [Hyphomicrobiales bacterium]
MKRALFAVSALAGMTLLGAEALALEPYLPRTPRVFERIDADGNGKITLAEIKPKAETGLMKLDTDGNGEVSGAEIDAYLQKAIEQRRARLLAAMDTDKSGSITKVELDKFIDAMFNGADANGDGGVTLQEARDFKVVQWRKRFLGQAAN